MRMWAQGARLKFTLAAPAVSCAAFDFWRYLTESMEDDFSNIVGVNLEMVS